MATIRQQASLTLKHPFFKESLSRALQGDLSGFERLLYEVQAHTWERCALDASRVYGKFHRLNHMDIKRELRDMPPPDGLDLKLPIPDPIAFLPQELPELDFMLTISQEPTILTLKHLKPLKDFNPLAQSL